MGRGTFEKVLSFPSWPFDKKVYVLSSTIKQVPVELINKVSILSSKPSEVLNYLSQKGYSSLYIDGGKVIQEFLKEGLIDELIISKAPILIGSGIPLFGHLETDIHFKHIRTIVAGNGLVRSFYEKK